MRFILPIRVVLREKTYRKWESI